jgi:hypothetical protein
MKIQMTIGFELEEDLYPDTEEIRLWLENDILIADGSLILHSNEIGDEVGVIKKVTNIQYLK